MQIRNMTINDYERVYDLWVNTKGMGLNELDDSRDGIRRYLERNPNTCFVAEKNERIIGVIMSGHDGRRGYIYHMAVLVEERKAGIGGDLVAHVLHALKEEGIQKVALVVFSDNEIGNLFWEKQGFTDRKDLTYRNKSLTELLQIEIE